MTAQPVSDHRALAEAVIADAIDRFVESRRARIRPFVDRNFTVSGSLRLHRHAVGLDMLRAPWNVAAGVATAAKKVAVAGMRFAGARRAAGSLDRRNFFLRTRVGQEIEWRVHTELLELPFQQPGRSFERDALMEAILEDPRIEARLAEMLATVGKHLDDGDFRARLQDNMTEYVGSRAAASDITSSLFAAATGFLAYNKFTPGVAALSGTVAGSIAHGYAVTNFWAGSWAGSLYYSLASAHAPVWLYAGVFASIMVPVAALMAFAGVVADPVQRRLGVHERRLNRLVDAVGRNLKGDSESTIVIHDHYVARVLDMLDWMVMVARTAKS